jgi:hypothetical protein
MAKLELDSYMDGAELASTIQEAMALNQNFKNSKIHSYSEQEDGCNQEGKPQYYEALCLNCIDVDLPTAAAVSNLIVSQSWTLIEFEECTGHLEYLLTIVMTCAAAGQVEKIKIVAVGSNRLDDVSLFALAVGMQRCKTSTAVTTTLSSASSSLSVTDTAVAGKRFTLKEIRLSLTLTREDAWTLSRGLDCRNSNDEYGEDNDHHQMNNNTSVSTIQSFCLWDCTLEPSALEILAQEGLRYNTSLREVGLVACTITTRSIARNASASSSTGLRTCEGRDRAGDACLATLLESLYHHPTLERLDFRCLATSDITPIAAFLEQPQCRLKSLDLSFKSGSGNEPIDLGLLTTAFRNRNAQGYQMTLERLHLSGLFLTDEDVEAVMETCVEASSSLDTLTLSLNKITDEGILQCVARRIANNGMDDNFSSRRSGRSSNNIRLKRLYLDGNPFHEEGCVALLDAMKTNVDLEELRIPPAMEECQRELDYYARLNRGGRRLVSGNEVIDCRRVEDNDANDHPNESDRDNLKAQSQQQRHRPCIPLALWSLVLARANHLDFEQRNNYPSGPGRADVVFYLLRNGPILFPV